MVCLQTPFMIDGRRFALGQLIACDVAPGQYSNDLLDTPLIQCMRGIVWHKGLLDAVDCMRATLHIWAKLVAHNEYSLMPLPLTDWTSTLFEAWVTASVDARGH
jgi:hypothetical protein